MKKKHLVCSIRSINFLMGLLLLAGIYSGPRAQAQNIDLTPGCASNTLFAFPSQVAGTTITTPAISATNIPGGETVTMSIRLVDDVSAGGTTPICPPGLPPCVSPVNVLGITITATLAGTITFSGTIDATAAGHTISFTIRATASGGSSCDRNYEIPIIRKPVDYMVVLDGSGSMEWGYSGPPSVATPNRRWDGLKTGIGIMNAQLSALTLQTDDRLGFRMFSTAVIVPGAPFNANLVPMTVGNIGLLTTAVPADQPGGWTALGDGILAGRNMLLTGVATNTKAMIVFSDGEQNRGDLIKEIAPNAYQETVSAQNISNSGQIKFYTINLGVSGSNPLMMSKIADNNGGSNHYLNTPAGAAGDFTTFFSMQLANILSGSSPQIVDVRKGSFPVSTGVPSVTEQSFSINKGAGSLIVTLVVPTRNEAIFTSFMKNGTELIQFAQQSSGPGYKSISLRLPHTGVTSLHGDWKIKAQLGTMPKTEIPYTLMVVTDDHIVHPAYSLGGTNFKVGNSISPTVSLKLAGGKPVTNASVKALILVPGDDINDLLATTQATFNATGVDSASPDINKLAVLMNDSVFVNKIKEQSQLLNLVYNPSDSTYKGTFNGLNVAGVYQVLYRISGNDPVLGKIERFHQISFYVRFPDISFAQSNIVSSFDAQTGNSILTARFVSTKGKFIGPGWGSAISINAPGLKIQKVQDMGDGTYKIYFDGKLAGNGKLALADETFYDGNLSNIGKGNGGSGIDINKLLHEWWFWVLLLLLIIIIIIIMKKKKP